MARFALRWHYVLKWPYVLKWLGQLAGTLAAASVLIFALLRVLPGDAASVALGIHATPDALATWRQAHGTDRPLIVQYVNWLGGLVRGDFGTSFVSGQELTGLIVDRAQVTMLVVALALVVAVVAATVWGVLAARFHRSWLGSVISAVSGLGMAVPGFLVGVLLVGLFAVRLRWLPAGGWVPFDQDPVEFWRRIILPVLSLATVQTAILTRYVRSSVVELMREDWVRTARAGGLTMPGLMRARGLRHAAVPLVTMVGLQFSTLLIGAVVVERVFVIPGLGSLLVDSVAHRDMQAVQGIVMLLVTVMVVVGAAVEVAYRLLDPRLRGSRPGSVGGLA